MTHSIFPIQRQYLLMNPIENTFGRKYHWQDQKDFLWLQERLIFKFLNKIRILFPPTVGGQKKSVNGDEMPEPNFRDCHF